MKRIFLFGFLVLVLAAAAWGVRFLAANFSGVRPAILPPPRDIAGQLPPPATGPVRPGANGTGLPLRIPDGFSMSVFAKGLGSPRVLALDPDGRLLVSIPARGTVVALPDADADGTADQAVTVIGGLNRPHGLAFAGGSLFVAETDGVAVYTYDTGSFQAANRKKLFGLPGGGNHFTRTIGFGPDGKLYVSVGSSCNVCRESDPRRAKLFTAGSDGTGFSELASGLRNSVFFTWHPVTRMLWATDMGRDLIGDDVPPDEINIIEKGKFYGWPLCYGKRIHDTAFDASGTAKSACAASQPSYIDIPAHSAPLGLSFVPAGSQWPEEYWNNLLVAYHGSWNRSAPTGYKVVRYKLDEKGAYLGEEDFVTGWLAKDGALGRPVDVLFGRDGALFLTDDKAGLIYRIVYSRS